MDKKNGKIVDTTKWLLEALAKINTILLPIFCAAALGFATRLLDGINTNAKVTAENARHIAVNREAFDGQSNLLLTQLKLLIKEHESSEGHGSLAARVHATEKTLVRIESRIEAIATLIEQRMP